MALHFDLTGITDCDRVVFEEVTAESGEVERRLTARADALIWATMFVGIDRITKENAEEFYLRLAIRERVFGALRYRINQKGEREDIRFTLDDIRQHVGLSTNADRLTDLQFDKKVMKQLRGEMR